MTMTRTTPWRADADNSNQLHQYKALLEEHLLALARRRRRPSNCCTEFPLEASEPSSGMDLESRRCDELRQSNKNMLLLRSYL